MTREELEDLIRTIVKEEIEYHCESYHYYRGDEE